MSKVIHYSLPVLHQRMMTDMKSFNIKKKQKLTELGHLENQLKKLQQKSNLECSPEEIGRKIDLKLQISDLKKQITIYENRSNIKKYFQHVGHIIYHYYNDKKIENINTTECPNVWFKINTDKRVRPSNRPKKMSLGTKIMHRERQLQPPTQNDQSNKFEQRFDFFNNIQHIQHFELMEDYLHLLGKNSDHYKGTHTDLEVCPRCKTERKHILSEGVVVCPTCSRTSYLYLDHNRHNSKENIRETNNAIYKRIGHFDDIIKQIEGQNTKSIPSSLFDDLQEYFNKYSFIDKMKLTISELQEILKKLNYSTQYENIYFIFEKITGRPSIRFKEETKMLLREMFKQIQLPYEKHRPHTRTNFINYSYVFIKFLMLIGDTEPLVHFSLLKDRNKLYETELMWKKICNELDWPFISCM